ncbi:hypothetical protein AB0A63_13785 [Lentzea sp. NPDC042327]|uniref:hypothetical protein n=1 Tax=Lentzea sp. NPDC042327 TaxID=3154801 RepID=UPI00340F657B
MQVGLAGNVSAAAHQLTGSMRGPWEIVSSISLEEFLARPYYEIPDGTPVIRLDLTGHGVTFANVFNGPRWTPTLRAGQVQPSLTVESRRHNGEAWTTMRDWWAAPDVYAALAPSAGIVVERLPSNRATPPR